MLSTLAHRGAVLALVLVALAFPQVASAAEINAAPAATYAVAVFFGLAAVFLPLAIFALVRLVGIQLTADGREAVKRMVEDALAMAQTEVTKYAANATVHIENERVAGVAGYVLTQGPKAMRRAGITEQNVVDYAIAKLSARALAP